MLIEIIQLVFSSALAEIARRANISMSVTFRERVFQIHHNLIGLGCIVTSFLFPNINMIFFGSGLVLHHLMREGW